MTAEIYQMILDFLHITQTPDTGSQHRIENEIDAGIRVIRKYIDPDASCEPGTESGSLLCEYVLRAESGAMATFEEDFAQDIVQGYASTQARQYAEAMGYDQE